MSNFATLHVHLYVTTSGGQTSFSLVVLEITLSATLENCPKTTTTTIINSDKIPGFAFWEPELRISTLLVVGDIVIYSLFDNMSNLKLFTLYG